MRHRIRRNGAGATRKRSRKRGRRTHIAVAAVLLTAIVAALGGPALADPRMTVNLTPLAGAATVPAGDNLSYTGFLECSIPAGCQGVEITFTAPTAASGPGTIANPVPPDIDSWSVQPDGSIVALADNIVAGRSIQLTVSWPTINYFTPPGLYPITMTVDAANDDGTASSDDAAVAVTATPNPAIEKTGPAEVTFGSQITYNISASNNPPAGQVRGTLALEDATLTDDLPDGTTFISASPPGFVYDDTEHTVTWPIDTDPTRPGSQWGQVTEPPGELRFAVTVRVDTPAGSTLTNIARANCNPFGPDDTPVEVTSEAVMTTVNGGTIGAGFTKIFNVTQAADGQQVTASLIINNRGGSTVTAAVIDQIPAGIDPTAIALQQVDVSGAWPGEATFIIRREGGGETSHPYQQRRFVIPAGAEVTEVEIQIPTIPAGMRLATRLEAVVDAAEIGGAGEIENCATFFVSDDDEELPPAERCDSLIVVPQLVRAVISKFTDQTPVGPGATHVWRLGITNDPTSDNSPPLRAYIVDRLPGELDYVADSWTLVAGQPDFCPTADQFTITWEPGAEYPDDGRLVVVAAPDALIPPNASTCEYEFRTLVKPGMASGVYGGTVADPAYAGNIVCLFDADNPLWSPLPDIDDCDEDGDTTETRGFAGDDFAIAESSGLFLFKEVRGDQDPEFLAAPEFPVTDPAIGTSLVDGVVDWRLTVGNLTNKDLTHVAVYDILPAPGSPGVTSGRLDDPLVSEWRPTLTGPIDAGGAPVEITYSTEINPCRPELDNTPDHSAPFFCDGEIDPTFVPAAQVSDWAAIHSVRFWFGEEVFSSAEQYTFTYRMAVPTVEGDNSPFEGGEITWNKSAGHADRLEPNGDLIPLLATEPAWVAAVVFVAPQAPPKAPPKTPAPGPTVAKTGIEAGDYLFVAWTMIAFGVLLNICGRQRRLAIGRGYDVVPAWRRRSRGGPRPPT